MVVLWKSSANVEVGAFLSLRFHVSY
jgi:hypothetical protein